MDHVHKVQPSKLAAYQPPQTPPLSQPVLSQPKLSWPFGSAWAQMASPTVSTPTLLGPRAHCLVLPFSLSPVLHKAERTKSPHLPAYQMSSAARDLISIGVPGSHQKLGTEQSLTVVGKHQEGFKVNLTLDSEFPECLLAQRRLKGLDPAAGRALHGTTWRPLTLAFLVLIWLLFYPMKKPGAPYFFCMDGSIGQHSKC